MRLAWFDHVKKRRLDVTEVGVQPPKKNMNLMGPSWEQLVPGHPDSCRY